MKCPMRPSMDWRRIFTPVTWAGCFGWPKELEYGMVCINDGILSTETAPFGGVKESGTGREGSKYGMDEYIEIKYITLAGINSLRGWPI